LVFTGPGRRTFNAGPRGLSFKSCDSRDPRQFWPRDALFAVEGHRIILNRSQSWS